MSDGADRATRRELARLLLRKQGLSSGERPPARDRSAPEDRLSLAQEQIWLHHRLEPQSPAYHSFIAVRLHGPLHHAAMERALDSILQGHEVLRSRFRETEAGPRCAIAEQKLVLSRVDCRNVPESRAELVLREQLLELVEKPFDLGRGPLVRTHLLVQSEEEHLLVFVTHHIVWDGWSTGLLFAELSRFYDACRVDPGFQRSPPPAQYADYVRQERGRLSPASLERLRSYWLEQLAGAPQVLDLPADRPRPLQGSFRGERLQFEVDAGLAAALAAAGRRSGATRFQVYAAVVALLLSRYARTEDLLLGTAVADRPDADFERCLGLFLDILVLRFDLSGRPRFCELLERVRTVCVGALSHREMPFGDLVRELAPARSPGRNPLFQVAFSFDNTPPPCIELSGLAAEVVEVPVSCTRFDLGFSLAERGGGIEGVLEYSSDRFERATIERMVHHFDTLLRAVAADPDARIGSLSLLSTAESQAVLQWGRGAPAPQPATILAQFARQAVSRPAAMALRQEAAWLSYARLDEDSDRVARRLTALGAVPGRAVATCLHRRLDTVSILLGIWKAGALYLPVDPLFPAGRIAFMVADARPALVLAEPAYRGRFVTAEVPVVAPEEVMAERAAGPGPGSVVWPAAEAPACLLYTSGSLGTPKAVVVEHGQLAHSVAAGGRAIGLTRDDAVYSSASLTFDISLFEVLAPLVGGGCVVLHTDPERLDMPALLEDLTELTVLHAVPSLMRLIVRAVAQERAPAHRYARLRRLLVGGDKVPPELLDGMRQAFPSAGIFVLYGPTEATIICTCYSVPAGAHPRRVLIGRPLDNVEVRLVDLEDQPTPPGLPGELLIGGAGVARGYLDLPELTRDRFVTLGGQRFFRTGDLARLSTDGNLEFLGRIDRQEKIRGVRVEPGETESALREHPAVEEAVVAGADGGDGERFLAAYVVLRQKMQVEPDELLAFLPPRLPAPWIPGALAVLPEIPLTPNGKVDYRRLPPLCPGRRGASPADQGQGSPLEEALAALWRRRLGVDAVGRDDDFFVLGGHSLAANLLLVQVRTDYGVAVSLRDFMARPTIRGLAACVERARRLPAAGARPAPVREAAEGAPLARAQEGLWWLSQLLSGSSMFKIVSAIRLDGDLEERALRRALDALVERHETLRTTFRERAGQPWQVVTPPGAAVLQVTDLAPADESEHQNLLDGILAEERARGCDLSLGPLFRAHLIRLAPRSHVLAVVLHHIIADGWSVEVLWRELGLLYSAFHAGRPSPLEAPALQYADFARLERAEEETEWYRQLIEFWLARLRRPAPKLLLPAGRSRPAQPQQLSAGCAFSLSRELTAILSERGRQHGATRFMTLLALFCLAFHGFAGQRSFRIAALAANRNRPGTEDLIGLFATTIFIDCELELEERFEPFLGRVREASIAALLHQEISSQILGEAMQHELAVDVAEQSQVLFLVEEFAGATAAWPGLALRPLFDAADTRERFVPTTFDLVVTLRLNEGETSGRVRYKTDLFASDEIESLTREVQRLLRCIAADSNPQIRELVAYTAAVREGSP